MNKPRPFILILFAFIMIPFGGFAQKDAAAAADEAFDTYRYAVAIERYKKAYTRVKGNESEKNRIIYQMGECYRLTNNLRRAEIQYRRLIRDGYENIKPELLLHYADVLKADEQYEEALEYYTQYTALVPEDPRGPNGVESCNLAIEWIENPSKHQVEEVKKLNSRESDFSPSYANSEFNTLIFTSTREGATGRSTDEWTDQNFSDLFISRIDRKGEWSQPVLLDNSDGEGEDAINTGSNEGAPIMNSDFTTLYFTRCPNEDKEISGCQIYTSRRTGRTFSAPELLLLGSDTNAVVGHPAINTDETIIYFSAERPGGFGGNDIWVATRESSREDFGRPMNLGPQVNTPGEELFPFLRADSILYFASDGHPGLGGLDIFKVGENEEGKWGKPVNMGVPINSSGDDFGIIFHPELVQGFFSSNRGSLRGKDNLYSFIIPPIEFTLTGIVKDDRTLQFIEAAEVELIGSDGTSVSTRTNNKGVYMFGKSQVKDNTTYEIVVSKEDYFTKKGTTTTVGLNKSEELQRDFMLQPIPEEPIVLPEILYDLAKWDLKPQYQDSLQGLIQTLDNNPTIVVELASHTDIRASDEYNDVLSQKRAQSVVDYLIMRGIDPDRLVAKGYGERVPRELKKDITRDGFTFEKGTVITEDFVNSLETEEEKEAAHQLNRRTEFRVLRKDFVPKPKKEIIAHKGVDVVVNPEEIKLPYTTDPTTGEIQAICTVNGYSMQFTYQRDARSSISLEKALELLKKGAIGKNDFQGDANAALADGTIANNALFNVEELTIANQTVYDVEFKVNHKLRHPLMIGKLVMNKVGDFRLDEANKEIIFEPK
ncbi:MAG: OmpA family protein [Bacteroidales bacterium]|nr:OmpA family protein [Bacteroidales bacterium]MCF8398632.1 OmpA family protein [Bacteroidales bacterium]